MMTGKSKDPFQQVPEGPSTQYERTLVPKTMKSIVFGTRNLKYWLLGPSGSSIETSTDSGPRDPTSSTKSPASKSPGHEGPGSPIGICASLCRSLSPKFRELLGFGGSYEEVPPGPQQYLKQQPVVLCIATLGHYLT